MNAYEYKIIVESAQNVIRQVNDLAQEGWSVVGPAIPVVYGGQIMLSQTLTKPTEQRGPWS